MMTNRRTPMLDALHAEIRQALNAASSIALVSHIRPDGDAIGAVLGLGLALQNAGKSVQFVLADGVPSSFRHLTGAKQVRRSMDGTPDLVAVLDCSDLERTGGVLGERVPDLNVDHHVTNLNFGKINLVAPEAVATCALLAEVMPAWGLEITQPSAEALLSGLVTDTIGFRTSNINAQALRLAADLMDRGADLAALYKSALLTRSFEAARYWGAGLSDLQRDGRLVWATLRLGDRAAAGYTGNDDADLVNVVSAIEGGDIALMFIEQKDNRVKVSWRAQPGLDVSQIALQFGGGGHRAASGADVPGTLAEVQERVLAATREVLAQQNGNGTPIG